MADIRALGCKSDGARGSPHTLDGLQLVDDVGQQRHLHLRRVNLPEPPALLGKPVPACAGAGTTYVRIAAVV